MGPIEHIIESYSRVRGWYPVRIDTRRYHCDPNHVSFWSRVNNGSWEPQTFSILNKLLTPTSVYCDIGAWIGPTVLHAANTCARVYCLEPDRTAYMYLLQNIRLNHLENVLPFNCALAAENGMRRLSSPRGKRGDSMTSLLRPDGNNSQEVLCLTWQTWLELAGKPRFDLIKIDIEGGEYSLLSSIADYLKDLRPNLYLSLHPHLLPETRRYAAMQEIMAVLSFYDHYYDSSGRKWSLHSLLEEQPVQQPDTYLFLP